MLYAKSNEEFSIEDFQLPGSCYRGAPFWAWNCRITKEMIEEQIQYFKEMGMGGFHVHVRVGLKNQYMDEDFLELVQFCNEKAKENGMLCWLYDEDRYSSGTAGGEVTKRIEFRARMLRLTTCRREDMADSQEIFEKKQHNNEKVTGCLLRVYDIVLKDGCLYKSTIIDAEGEAQGTKWYLYEELDQETPWINDQTYVDTMNHRATEYFIEKTHEKYASHLQEAFGKSIPAIFTDEPNIKGMKLPAFADAAADICLPFTEELPEKYLERCGMDFYRAIPDIIWNRNANGLSSQRYYFFEVCCEQFVSSYCKPIGQWCQEQGILSTGHVLAEESLRGQSQAVGEAMRCYREFQLPGIDNLCDYREYSAVKQASSVAHQYGREGVLSELYGVTQWDFPFEGYKLAGDWQAALGVTTRVPHLAWASMGGEAKRDYPAAIGWQSPWYHDFRYVEDYFARINYCLTRGKPLIQVGMIHPIETMWCYQGPADQMGLFRDQLEADFKTVTECLLTGGIDFDYISEALLSELPDEGEAGTFGCGEMAYRVILVPDCITLRKTTLKRLERFAGEGGTVLICGEPPQYIECKQDEQLKRFLQKCQRIPITQNAILTAMEPWREIYIQGGDGKIKDIYLSQQRQEGDSRWVFVAQAYKGEKSRKSGLWEIRPLHKPQTISIRIKGEWSVSQLNTLTGEIIAQESQQCGKWTELQYDMYGNDSLMLHLKPVSDQNTQKTDGKKSATALSDEWEKTGEPIDYRNSEPNVLLLDHFNCALDEGLEVWENCELLKLDNLLRTRLGYHLRAEAVVQPYIRQQKDIREHVIHLSAVIYSEVELSGCMLALEEAEYCTGTLNGQVIQMSPKGYYVDSAIRKVLLPDIRQGENELVLHIRYGRETNLEWMYLLGEFGVQLMGRKQLLVQKPQQLYWGDYTRQGFPFYTGNMTYYVSLKLEQPVKKVLQVPYFSGAAVKVAVNGEQENMIAFLPYICNLDGLRSGDNQVAITCLGNRYNGFGQLHMIGDDVSWLGPDSWRTEGNSWTDTYQIKQMGILSAPVLGKLFEE